MVTGLMAVQERRSRKVRVGSGVLGFKTSTMGCSTKSRGSAAIKFGDRIQDLHVNAHHQGFR